MSKHPERITYRGAQYVRTAVRYWYGTEDYIKGHMGLPIDTDADTFVASDLGIDLPWGIDAREILEVYEARLYDNVPLPDDFLDVIKGAAMAAIAKSVESLIGPEGDWPDGVHHNLERLISLLGDEYAHEELFGAIGGEPEYNFKDGEVATEFGDWVSFQVDELGDEPISGNEILEGLVWPYADKATDEAGAAEWQEIEEGVSSAFKEARDAVDEHLRTLDAERE